MPILMQIQRNPQLWNQNTLRTTHQNSPHTQVDDIWIRFNELPPAGQEHLVMDQHESIWYPAIHTLTEIRPFINALMARVNGERLGRIIITKMKPGAKIDPHIDSGDHAEYYERHHLCLQNTPGSVFRCGDESVYMAPGEVWWFNNQVEHEVINNGSDDRLTLIVDIKVSKC